MKQLYVMIMDQYKPLYNLNYKAIKLICTRRFQVGHGYSSKNVHCTTRILRSDLRGGKIKTLAKFVHAKRSAIAQMCMESNQGPLIRKASLCFFSSYFLKGRTPRLPQRKPHFFFKWQCH